MRSLFLTIFAALLPIGQVPEPAISKDAISVHKVVRGTMPLREMANGTISSTDPPRATLSLALRNADAVRTGQIASIQIKPPKAISGKVVHIAKSDSIAAVEMELDGPLPKGATVGLKVYGLVETGELADVVYFERPGDSRPNTESIIFLLEPDGEHAKRVRVRYGKQSDALMEIITGLSPGDRVIVTDMSAWAGYERVRLQ